ncbi:hypothetical protein [Noviherbaspirillum aridicola]|uniref:Antitoxin protein of toxin-antitoxin system n=1 Tax=Noviherbaspirillum aridicola TaxID=2849687 RepID=A0ABQ4Q030_9BURK|nr:hypothetical protein [Noviherbaspirillum aridicola]GIZ50435.1 hypothetical protein NCCP691_04490 [Noviherbaspirillum aridicola]
MNEQQSGKQVAQPADEEIKKHGDQLQKQVDTVAGKPAGGDGSRPQDRPGGPGQ